MIEVELSEELELSEKLELSEEPDNLAMSLSILGRSRAGGMCVVGSWLNTAILVGRQLLKLPDRPVHARILVSPELVSSCAKNRPSALSPSPYTTRKDIENIPSNE